MTADSTSSYEIEEVLKALNRRTDAEQGEAAAREYALLPLVKHQGRALQLHELMVNDPNFFHQILCDVYRGDNEEPSELDELKRARWHHAYALLSDLSAVPGFQRDPPNQYDLSSWIDRVRELGQQTNRAVVTYIAIGKVLAHAPLDSSHGGWPHRFVRIEIERAHSDELERGLRIERFNMRGVTTRGVWDGGIQERELASSNREYALKAASWPRTAALLGTIAEGWEADAEREDLEVRKRRLRS